MRELIRLFVEITLLRRGPQDLPASFPLLVLTVGAYVAVTALASGLLPPSPGWPVTLAIDVVFTLGWYAALLQFARRGERFLQTATAVFGLQMLLTPPLVACEWLVKRLGQDDTWQTPVAIGGFAIVIWLIAANSHVVKAALEWSSAASVALVILQIVCGELLVFTLVAPGGG